MKLSLFDRVLVRRTGETNALQLGGAIGQVLGMTQPSASGEADIVGGAPGDLAIYLDFESPEGGLWINPDLIEFADGSPVTEFSLPQAGVSFLRDPQGHWQRSI